RERRLREELRPRQPAVAGDETVLAEMFLVEEHRGTKIELLKRVARGELAVALDLDAEFLDQPLRRVAVRIGRRNALRAAVADEGAPVVLKLVALRVAAEIVVIVEDQNFFPGAERFLPEVRGREPRDAAAA